MSVRILSEPKPSSQGQFHPDDQHEPPGDGLGIDTPIRIRAESAARVSALAEFLPPAERSLVRWVYQDGKSIAELAGLMRVPRSSLARRVRRLADRCRTPEFAFVAAHAASWPAPLAHVARACVLEARSVRSAAATLNMTVHAARSLRREVLAMCRGVQHARKATVDRRWRT